MVEDCPVTYDDLRARGYSEEVIEIVRLISKDPHSGLTFRQWITALADSGHVAAVRVKLADLADNLSPARLKTLPPEMRGIDRRFRMAWQIIAARLPETEMKSIIRGAVPPLAEIERAFALNGSSAPT